MPLKISWCNRPLVIKNLRRYWPLWVTYTLSLFLMFTLQFEAMIGNARRNLASGFEYEDVLNQILRVFQTHVAIFPAIAAILVAMACFSYLHATKSMVFFHSLPCRRETLFGAGVISGLIMLLGPVLLIMGISVCQFGLAGFPEIIVNIGWLSFFLLCYSLLFFGFAVLCAMVAGHLISHVAFYVILQFVQFYLQATIGQYLQAQLYGFTAAIMNRGYGGYYFSPLISLLSNWDSARYFTSFQFSVAVYGLAGLVLLAVSLFLYRKRLLEGTGDVVAVNRLMPVFRWGIALCGALLLYSIIEGISNLSQNTRAWPAAALLLTMLSLLCYLAAEMILKKSFRIFRHKLWRGAMIFTALVLAFSLGVSYDWIGFETKLPNPAQIEAVFIGGYHNEYIFNEQPSPVIEPLSAREKELRLKHMDSSYGTWAHEQFRVFSEPQHIALVLDMHRAILASKDFLEQPEEPFVYPSNVNEEQMDAFFRDYYDRYAYPPNWQLVFSYKLTDGKVMTRIYHLRDVEHGTPLADSYASYFTLFNSPESLVKRYFFPGGRQDFDYACFAYEVPGEANRREVKLDADLSRALYDAMNRDIAEGRVISPETGSARWRSSEKDAVYIPQRAVFFVKDYPTAPGDPWLGGLRTMDFVLDDRMVSSLFVLRETGVWQDWEAASK